jgi:hypothetical protein
MSASDRSFILKETQMISILDPASIQPPEMTLVAAVWMGALTSVHVCAVARLPILAAYIMGAGVPRRHALMLTVLFALGLAAATVLVGLTAIPMAGGVHRAFQVNKCLFWILGSCLVVVGVLISGLINLHLVPEKWRSVAERLVRTDGLGALLLGIALGLLQIPACPTCRAELLRVVESAAVGSLFSCNLILLVGFTAGQSCVVLSLGALISVLRPSLLTWLRMRMCSIEPRMQLLIGNMLVVLGIYFVVVG